MSLRTVRRAAGKSWAGKQIKGGLAAQAVRRLDLEDPTLSAVVEVLRKPVDGEQTWVTPLEQRRAQLEASTELIPFGAPGQRWSADGAATRHNRSPRVVDGVLYRDLGELTWSTSKSADWCRLFFRIARRLQPQRCLELGTSVGISGSYIGAALTANGIGRLVTMEGMPGSAAVSTRGFEEVGVAGHVEVLVGWFNDRLDEALSSLGGVDLAFVDGHHEYDATLDYFRRIAPVTAPGGLLVFDDVVYWDKGMARAWQEIQDDPRVTGSLTIGSVGFAVIGGLPVGQHRIPFLHVQ